MINTIAKCIGGFYWLIFMLWRGNSVPPPKQIPTYDNRLAILDRMDTTIAAMSSPYVKQNMNTNSWAYKRRINRKDW